LKKKNRLPTLYTTCSLEISAKAASGKQRHRLLNSQLQQARHHFDLRGSGEEEKGREKKSGGEEKRRVEEKSKSDICLEILQGDK
jgi:hypothetical protein